MGRERETKNRVKMTQKVRSRWQDQHDAGVWTFSRREIQGVFSWYKRKKNPKHKDGEKRPERKGLGALLGEVSDQLLRERLELVVYHVLPDHIPDEKHNSQAISKLKDVTLVRTAPEIEGGETVYVATPTFKHSKRRALQ
jgi:hypothetical protein